MAARKKTAPAADDGLCTEHWPLGWATVPAEHSGVGCEHGTWTRPGIDADADGADDGDVDES